VAIRVGLHGGSMATLDWAVNAYNLTFAAGIVAAAAFGDRLGRLRLSYLRLSYLRLNCLRLGRGEWC
jgi:MFS family permease